MTTHRIVLLISDEEIAKLDGAIESLDTLAANYEDDWHPDEEPRASLDAQCSALYNVLYRIKREVSS